MPADISNDLNAQARELAQLIPAARGTGDPAIIERANALAREWDFAKDMAYGSYPDSTVRAQLSYVDEQLLRLKGMLEKKGISVIYPGVVMPAPLPATPFTSAVSSFTTELVQGAGSIATAGLGDWGKWLLPVGAGLLLLLVLRR